MKIIFKITENMLNEARRDLRRPHPFAEERIGFFTARCTRTAKGLLILASKYIDIPDNGYLHDDSVGAMMNQATILTAMQAAYSDKVGIIHVHLHEHHGRPSLSRTDWRESEKFMPSFINVRPEYPHSALVLSADSMNGICWLPKCATPCPIDKFVVVGARYERIRQ